MVNVIREEAGEECPKLKLKFFGRDFKVELDEVTYTAPFDLGPNGQHMQELVFPRNTHHAWKELISMSINDALKGPDMKHYPNGEQVDFAGIIPDEA